MIEVERFFYTKMSEWIKNVCFSMRRECVIITVRVINVLAKSEWESGGRGLEMKKDWAGEGRQGQYPLLGHIKPDFIAILDWLEKGGFGEGGLYLKPPTLLLFNSVLSPRFQPLSITNRGWNVLDKCMPSLYTTSIWIIHANTVVCFKFSQPSQIFLFLH